MALYESTFIARQDISQQEVDKIAENFADLVKKQGGKIVKKEYWGLRNLAYKVKKNKKGHYTMFGIDANVEVINELRRQFRLSEDVIREMTVRVEEISKDPSLVMQQDERRDRRG